VIISFAFSGATRANDTTFGVQVGMGFGGVNHRFFNIITTDVHNMGLRVIKPDNCVIVGHIFPFCFDKTPA
jgi:hypothetical protein